MAVPDKIYSFNMRPGFQRDGTAFSSQFYIDGQWCRFYRQLPKKMGGYVQITDLINNIPRGIYVLPIAPNFDVYIGDQDSLGYVTIDANGNAISGLIDRTPALFQVNPNNVWSFDVMFSTVDNGSILIANAAPNLSAIDNSLETPVYYGDANSNTPLIPTGFTTSGGIVVLHPYLFIFGNNGDVLWTNANDPTTELNSARVTASKIVAGLSSRGGNSSPAGLLWSLDSLIRVTFVGPTPADFAFDTVTSESSMLSSQGVIEYDGVYYWAGVDRFLFYNGIVQELPNSMSLRFFFTNLNMAQRQKVWATKITSFGEIWWHFPTGTSLECNHAVVYNVREKTWYDTAINRSDGYFDQTFAYPIWASNTANSQNFLVVWSSITSPYWSSITGFTWANWPVSDPSYSIWMHENGVDQNVNGTLTSIESHFESGNIAWVAFDMDAQRREIDRWVYLYRIEPDFIQTGNLTCIVNGKEYARSPVTSSTITWSQWNNAPWYLQGPPAVPNWATWGDYVFDENTIKIDMREQRREMTLKFHSNTIGGYYELGQTLLVGRIGDARQ